jgi:hypothetical protein
MSTPCSRVLRPKAQVPTHKLPTHKLDLEDLLNNPRPPKRSKIAHPTSSPRHIAPTVPKTPAPQDSSKSTGKRKSPLERASKYLQCLCFVYLLTLKQKKTLQSYRHRPPAIKLSFHAMIYTRPTTHCRRTLQSLRASTLLLSLCFGYFGAERCSKQLPGTPTSTPSSKVRSTRNGKGQGRSWKELTVDELKIWLGITILMGVTREPSVKDYWRNDDGCNSVHRFTEFMSLCRFEQIKRYIHISLPQEDDGKLTPESENQRPDLWYRKVAWLLDHLEACAYKRALTFVLLCCCRCCRAM